MMNIRRFLLSILVILILTGMVSCGEVETEQTEPGGVLQTEQEEEDAVRRDAEVYAEYEGVSVDEAVRRFELIDDAGPLQAEIVKNEESYAGSWIQHQPEYKFVFAFTENGEEIIRKYVKEDSPLAGLIELRTFEVSYRDLKKAQEEMMQLLKEVNLDFFCPTSIDIKENTAIVYVSDIKLFNEILDEAGVVLPPHVTPEVTYEPLEEVHFELNPPDPPINFPQLKMRGGEALSSIARVLVLKDGYLRFDDIIIIWQPDYFLNDNNGTIEVLDREGKMVAREGKEVYMTCGGLSTVEEANKYLKESLPDNLEGPFIVQGHGTRLNLNFSSELFSIEITSYQGHDFYTFNKKPGIDEMTGCSELLTGKLQTSYSEQHFRRYPVFIVDMNGYDMECAVIWPAVYEAWMRDDTFEIVDSSGNVLVRDGKTIKIEGEVFPGINSPLASRLYKELPYGCIQPYLVIERILN
jgi:hypothetical protein